MTTLGIVTSVGIPTTDDFTFNPFGEYRANTSLTGAAGTLYYINPTGSTGATGSTGSTGQTGPTGSNGNSYIGATNVADISVPQNTIIQIATLNVTIVSGNTYMFFYRFVISSNSNATINTTIYFGSTNGTNLAPISDSGSPSFRHDANGLADGDIQNSQHLTISSYLIYTAATNSTNQLFTLAAYANNSITSIAGSNLTNFSVIQI
jgi:hypothetical protein